MLANRYNLCLALTVLLLSASSPAALALTNSEVLNAINSARILDAGVGVNARVDKDRVTISTYRNPKNNDKDCKIDAVMIAKVVSEASKDAISRITVCFYGRDMSRYQEVSITAGDLKAFAAGQTGQEQLLSSLEVHTQTVANGADKVANQLESSSSARPSFSVAMRGENQLMITSPMGPWVSDEECKLEGLKIASIASTSAPDSVQQITVSFVDPRGQAETRQLTFTPKGLPDAWRTVQTALSVFPMSKQAAGDMQALQTKDGPLKEARDQLLSRLNDLAKKGVGLAPFMRAFQAIEAQAASGDTATLQSSIDRLSSSLDDQEKAYKAAKEDRPKANDPQTAAANLPPIQNAKGFGGGRWSVLGNEPIIAAEVLPDPAGFVRKYEKTLAGNTVKLAALYDAVIKILKNNGRAPQAVPFEQRLAQLRGQR